MSAPTLAEQIQAILDAKDRISAALTALEGISPDLLKGPEEVLRVALVAALTPLDVVAVGDSLMSVGKVVAAGKGIVGGGFDSNLA